MRDRSWRFATVGRIKNSGKHSPARWSTITSLSNRMHVYSYRHATVVRSGRTTAASRRRREKYAASGGENR